MVGEPASPRELQEQIAAVTGRSIEEHMSVIKALSLYFQLTEPRFVHYAVIQDTAAMLHNCRVRYDPNIYKVILHTKLSEAVVHANIVAGYVEQGNLLVYDALMSVLKLGTCLQELASLIPYARI